MVMPGAFAQTLQQRGVRRVPMLFQHDPAEPIGVWLELREDCAACTRAAGSFPRWRARANCSRWCKRRRGRRAVDRLSHREGPHRSEARASASSTQVDLWEISIVTFPLLAGARVRAVKEARLPSRPLSAAAVAGRAPSGASDPFASLTRAGAARSGGRTRLYSVDRARKTFIHPTHEVDTMDAINDSAHASRDQGRHPPDALATHDDVMRAFEAFKAANDERLDDRAARGRRRCSRRRSRASTPRSTRSSAARRADAEVGAARARPRRARRGVARRRVEHKAAFDAYVRTRRERAACARSK